MKISPTTKTLCLLVLTLVLSGCHSKRNLPPKAIVTNDTINLDTLYIGRPDTFLVKVTNDGGGELFIKDVYTDCNCTTASFDRETPILSDESADITVVYDNTNKIPAPFEGELRIVTSVSYTALQVYFKGVNRYYYNKEDTCSAFRTSF